MKMLSILSIPTRGLIERKGEAHVRHQWPDQRGPGADPAAHPQEPGGLSYLAVQQRLSRASVASRRRTSAPAAQPRHPPRTQAILSSTCQGPERTTTFAMPTTDPWKSQMEALGAFIRVQRKLAELTSVSNPYLSQLERGLHQPSVRVLKSIATALNLSAETLLAQAGLLDDSGNGSDSPPQVEVAIRADPDLSESQKAALIAVFRSMRQSK